MPLKVLLSLNAFNVPCSDKNIIETKKEKGEPRAVEWNLSTQR